MPSSEIRFCQKCAGEMVINNIDHRIRAVCPSCGTIHYEHWRISAGVRIQQEGKLLLIQRRYDPWSGCWHMPSGYVEVDEEPIRAAERETWEETGLIVKAGRLVDIYSDCEDPRGNVLVIIYEGSVIDGEAKRTPEAMDIGYFDKNQVMNLPLAGTGAKKSIQDWVDGKTD